MKNFKKGDTWIIIGIDSHYFPIGKRVTITGFGPLHFIMCKGTDEQMKQIFQYVRASQLGETTTHRL